MFEVSMFTSLNPPRISKGFRLDDDGHLEKISGGQMMNGDVKCHAFENMAEFAEFLPSLTSAQALGYGICEHEKARIVAQKQLEKTPAHNLPVIARTREFFRYSDGTALFMLDYDPPKTPASSAMTADGLRAALISVCPEIEHRPMAIRPSASSHVYNSQSGECLKNQSGLRCWMLVQSGADIPRAGEILFRRLWLSGFGHIEISSAGSFLVRSILDAAVWQPERLDFCGGAACDPPLEQRLPAPEIFNPDASPLDTTTALPDLTPEEEAEYLRLVEESKRVMAPEAERIRNEWVEQRTLSALEKENPAPVDRPERLKALRECYRRAVESKILFGDFELTTSDGQSVTVGQILDDPDKWHNSRFYDPLEGTESNDSRVAMVNLRAAGRPYLWTHRHGGQRFRLVRARKEIRIIPGERVRTVDRTLELMRIDGGVFDRGGELVTVQDGGKIVSLDLEGLRLHLDGIARWTKWSGREKDWMPCDCPDSVVKGVLAKKGAWGLPTLKGTATAPYFDPESGKIVETDGYNEKTHIVLHRDGFDQWEPVPQSPTYGQVEDALATMWEPFAGFPFCGDVDRGVWLSAVLTAATRCSLPTALGFLANAPTAGSGKTLLVRCLAILAGVNYPPMMTVTRDEGENQKRLFATGRIGDPAIVFDNIVGQFESAAFCTFLTDETFRDRVLGQSEVLSIPTRALALFSGNNVCLRGDLCRRILTCNIDPEMETPWKRSFDMDPARHCRDNRLKIVRAALVVLVAASQNAKELPDRTASFEAWSDSVRRAVVWVGEQGFMPVADPVLSIESAYAEDPETSKLKALLDAWHNEFGEIPATIAQAIKSAGNNEDFFVILDEIGGEGGRLNSRRLGRWIEKNKGRRVNFKWFTIAGEMRGVKKWKVTTKKSVNKLKKSQKLVSQSLQSEGLEGLEGFTLSYAGKCQRISYIDNNSDISIEGTGANPQNPPNPHFQNFIDDSDRNNEYEAPLPTEVII